MKTKVNQSKALSTFGLRGVGPQMQKHLARLDVFSPRDLLFHLPLRYQDRTRIQAIRDLRPDTEAVVEGVIQSVETPTRGRTKLLCRLSDGTRALTLRFFHVLPFQKDILKVGVRLRCYQDVRLGSTGLEMTHPEFKVIDPANPIPVDLFLTPIYPTTEGVSQYQLRKLTANALEWMQKQQVFQELLPPAMLQALSFSSLQEALLFVHRPPRDTSMDVLAANQTLAQQRLVFEELLAHRISLLNLKLSFQTQRSVAFSPSAQLTTQFLTQLPYQLTQAQQRVVREVRQDLSQDKPMLRLVQGDVGSGKTVVAALALLQAVENNYQAVMMAPTELLAEQHHRVMKRWLEPLGVRVVYLSGNVKGAARQAAFAAIANGEAQIILGTHALFQEDVVFKRLALLVIDEQHRFGVHQRALLREKGMRGDYFPHQLVMTATPIPRTLAMSFYADFDVSIIDELPPGRTPIQTGLVASTRRDEVMMRIREACKQGRQVYWVCPLIEESETIACQAATTAHEQLQQQLPELKVGLVHGRMRPSEKETVMQSFQRGDTHLLVATTVIEVGVDVPNASVMVIDNAERMGLSQLHQLRGRVGRGSVASHCLLLYQYPLTNIAKERLAVMRETNDGFKIAERDLELRGPGDVFGTRQTGDFMFRVADLLRDSHLLSKVQKAADEIIANHPELAGAIVTRWMERGKEYGQV